MYINIGWNKVIDDQDIIAILHIYTENKKKSPLYYYKNRKIINIHPIDKPKTYVITNDSIYVTPISINTITKRIKEASILKYK